MAKEKTKKDNGKKIQYTIKKYFHLFNKDKHISRYEESYHCAEYKNQLKTKAEWDTILSRGA